VEEHEYVGGRVAPESDDASSAELQPDARDAALQVLDELTEGGPALEVAIMIGLQASGKTTFCRQVLAADHVLVSKDAFPNARNPQRRQLRLIGEALARRHSVAVDNTNPSPQEWQPLIETARRHGAAPVGYWFPPDLTASQERNAVRDGRARVPAVGLYATLKRLRPPTRADGFDRLYRVAFDGAGGFDIRPLQDEE
jgi:predicted kinase